MQAYPVGLQGYVYLGSLLEAFVFSNHDNRTCTIARATVDEF
jgi:hypothetical protein